MGAAGAQAPDRATEQFKYEGRNDDLPEWIDKGWAGWDQGPALQVPRNDPRRGPYVTQTVRAGDTVVYEPGKNGVFGKFHVEQGVPDEVDAEAAAFRPAQETQASLEDMVFGGTVEIDRLTPEAKGQLYSRERLHGRPTQLPAEDGDMQALPPPQAARVKRLQHPQEANAGGAGFRRAGLGRPCTITRGTSGNSS